jgi:hypothetical protein
VILHVSLSNCILIVRISTELTFDFLDISAVSPWWFVLFDILAVLIVASLQNSVLQNVLLILQLSLLTLLLLVLLPNLLNDFGLWAWKFSYLRSKPFQFWVDFPLLVNVNTILSGCSQLSGERGIQLVLRWVIGHRHSIIILDLWLRVQSASMT